MNSEARDTITWTLGTFLSLCMILGLAVRFVLYPWLRDHLVTPVKATQRQVTENHHQHDPPTVIDRLEELSREVHAIANVMDQHLSWSDRWSTLVEREVDQLRREREGTE